MPGRILVVDDVATNRMILRAKLSAAYFDVIEADCGQRALDLARSEQPDLILLDVMMPDINGCEVCALLKAADETAHIPIVMVTATDAPEERIRGLDAGADDFLSKPINDSALFARVRNLVRVKIMFDELRLRDSTTRELGLSDFVDVLNPAGDLNGTVLLAAETPESAAQCASALMQKLDVQIFETCTERGAMRIASLEYPDAFIVNQKLSKGGDGFRLISNLRSNPHTRQAAVIFIVTDSNIQTAERALENGASDYIMAPFDQNELTARLRSQLRRKHYSDRLRSNVRDGLRMAVTDPLTGLYNRRYCNQHLGRITERARSNNSCFTLMMLDLDRFKQINDTYGHDAGDLVLIEFSRLLQENVRGVDLVARLGGEEFLVAMPDADIDAGKQVAERIRYVVENHPIILPDGQVLCVTVSIGAVVCAAPEGEGAQAMACADKALYRSKAAGRNQVTFHHAA